MGEEIKLYDKDGNHVVVLAGSKEEKEWNAKGFHRPKKGKKG